MIPYGIGAWFMVVDTVDGKTLRAAELASPTKLSQDPIGNSTVDFLGGDYVVVDNGRYYGIQREEFRARTRPTGSWMETPATIPRHKASYVEIVDRLERIESLINELHARRPENESS